MPDTPPNDDPFADLFTKHWKLVILLALLAVGMMMFQVGKAAQHVALGGIVPQSLLDRDHQVSSLPNRDANFEVHRVLPGKAARIFRKKYS